MLHFFTTVQIYGKEERKGDCKKAKWEAVPTKRMVVGGECTDGTWFLGGVVRQQAEFPVHQSEGSWKWQLSWA
jgi:hypothetical protein